MEDEKLKKDIAGLVALAREHGANSREVERYMLKTVRNYEGNARRDYIDLAAELLLKFG